MPEVGQDVEVIIRGTVVRLGAQNRVALVQRVDGAKQWVALPDLSGAVEWREPA